MTLGQVGLHVYDPKTLSTAIVAASTYMLDESDASIQPGELTYNISLTYHPP